MTKGSDIVAQILKRENVELLAGFPQNELFDSAAAVGIRPVIARTERVAVNIADGYTRASGGARIGVATAQYGPGAETSFGAMAQAFSDGVPMLFMPGAYPGDRSAVHPTFDAMAAFRPITKFAARASSVQHLPQLLHQALNRLRNGGLGPVMLEMPIDVLRADASGVKFDYRSPEKSRPGIGGDELERIVAMIARSSSPVIYAGQGVLYSAACAELLAFAETTGIPVATSLNGKSAFPENHRLSLGTAGRSRPAMVDDFLDRTDLVIGIGTSFTDSLYNKQLPKDRRLIQITIDPADIGKDFQPDIATIADARQALGQLAAAFASGTKKADVAGEIARSKTAFLEAWRHLLESDSQPLSPYRIVNELSHVVDKRRTVVTHDAGSPRDQVVPFYDAIVPHGYMGWGKSTQLGSGLGLMIGAKLARPDWTAINIMGEAAFGMVGLDLETALRCKAPILTIVLKNGVMGGYRPYMPLAADKYGATSLTGEYAQVAKAMGAYSERVEDPKRVRAAIEDALDAVAKGQTALLEFITVEENRLAGIA